MFHWQFFITYIFSVSLKFGARYTTGQWGEFIVKNAILCLHKLFEHFAVVFHQKMHVFIFYLVYFLFWWNIKFLQQNINQSETVIGDKELSVERYVKSFPEVIFKTFLANPLVLLFWLTLTLHVLCIIPAGIAR